MNKRDGRRAVEKDRKAVEEKDTKAVAEKDTRAVAKAKEKVCTMSTSCMEELMRGKSQSHNGEDGTAGTDSRH